MALKLAVVDGGALGFKASAPPVTGVVSFVSAPSTKAGALVSSLFKGIYKGNVQFKVASGCTNGTCTSDADYFNTFSPGSTKNKVEGDFPLREDDEKACSIPGKTGGGSACTISATIIVTNAGQTKVKME